MSDRAFAERLTRIAAIVALFVISFVVAGMPREIAPDVSESIFAVAAVLVLFPIIWQAIGRWLDGRSRP